MSQSHAPKITQQSICAESRYFKVEEVHLSFNNGEQRIYERLVGSGQGAVMIVPVTDDGHLLLVKEYAVGSERYELGFPKGLVDAGEQALDAANRELQEEVGFKAARLHLLRELSVAPGFLSGTIQVFVAWQLSPSQLEGDEPEPLDIVKYPINQLEQLLVRDDFNEARGIAALLLFERWWREQQKD